MSLSSVLAPVVAPRRELSGATEGLFGLKRQQEVYLGPQLGSNGDDPIEQTVLTWR